MKSIESIKFLALLVFIAFSCQPGTNKNNQSNELEETVSTEKWRFLVGTYTDDPNEGIYAIDMDQKTGELTMNGLAVATINPAFITITKDDSYVFAVNKLDSGYITSFKWDENNVVLEAINSNDAYGSSPAHITLNHANDQLAISHYKSGNITALPFNQKGELQDMATVRQHQGQGAVAERQEKPHAHFAGYGKDDKHLFVCDLGIDQIMAYSIDSTGQLGEGYAAITMEPGDGPRHMTFHPTKNYAFLLNELSGTVVSMKYLIDEGKFEQIDKKSTLPDDFTAYNLSADIHTTRNGQFLYVSNRGHNSIAGFQVGNEGDLTFISHTHVEGDWPRNFAISPDDRFLLVANRRTGNLTVFEIDPANGQLTYTGQSMEIPQPVSIAFFHN